VAFVLNFIVSGQIPGTPIVLTFQSVLAVASLFFGVALARQITKQSQNSNPINIEEITL
jgi:hypothetical protein